jgi:N utilization substance protein A
MEWHAADGTVMSESDWAASQAEPGDAETSAAEEAGDAVPEPSVDGSETGEGSASDEPDAARAQSEAEGEPAADTEGEPAADTEGEPAAETGGSPG